MKNRKFIPSHEGLFMLPQRLPLDGDFVEVAAPTMDPDWTASDGSDWGDTPPTDWYGSGGYESGGADWGNANAESGYQAGILGSSVTGQYDTPPIVLPVEIPPQDPFN